MTRQVDAFVKQRAPPAFVRTFARYKLPIQRIDTFRYVLMATVGGMYADLDNECRAAPELPGANITAGGHGGCTAYVATQGCTDTFLRVPLVPRWRLPLWCVPSVTAAPQRALNPASLRAQRRTPPHPGAQPRPPTRPHEAPRGLGRPRGAPEGAIRRRAARLRAPSR